MSGGGTPSRGRLLATSPPLRLAEGVLSAAECEDLLGSARYDEGMGRARRERGDILPTATAMSLRERIAAMLGMSEEFLEPLRLVRYSRPQHAFEPHVDWIVDATDPQLEMLGQRVATALVYLADVPADAGGATFFPEHDIRVPPRLGAALLWPNVAADGEPLWETEHEAQPLLREGVVKAAVNIWARDRPLPRDPAVLGSLLLS